MTFIFPFQDLEVEVKVNLRQRDYVPRLRATRIDPAEGGYYSDCEVVSVNWPDRVFYRGEGEKRERIVIHAEQQTDMNGDPVPLPTIEGIAADWDKFINAVNEAADQKGI